MKLTIEIQAPIERCFDLARSIDFHQHSMRATKERVVSGRNSGLIELHETVEFEGVHLGWTRRHEARITRFERPLSFVDEQIRGAFESLHHEHSFETIRRNETPLTRMTDRICFTVGWGIAGSAAGKLVVWPHLQRLLTNHQMHLKQALEGEEWKSYLRG